METSIESQTDTPNMTWTKSDKNTSTVIQHTFIDSFFGGASHSFIIVYIALLRLYKNGGIDISETADYLNMTEADIERAISFWVKNGAIAVTKKEPLEIEFLELVPPEPYPLENVTQELNEEAVTAQDNKKLPPPADTPAKIVVERCPSYSTKEIDFYLQNSDELRTLFKNCEGYLGKLLTYNDMSALFGFHDWLRMPINVIDLLVSYCASNERRSMRYIEKVAVIWADCGINTTDKAKAQIKLYNGDFRAIMKELGKAHREPVKKEEEYMLKWLKIYEMPLDVVLAACTKTVMQAQRPTFKYADGILEKWHTMGITTLDEIEKADSDHKNQSKAAKTEKNSVKKRPRSKFANFRERDDIDFDEMRRLEMERIDKELGL